MTDAEKKLIDAVILWQACNYPVDRKKDTQHVKDAVDRVLVERAPINLTGMFTYYVLAQSELPRDDFDAREWDAVFGFAHDLYYFTTYGDPILGTLGKKEYEDLEDRHKKAFHSYFVHKYAIAKLNLSRTLFDKLYNEACESCGVEPRTFQ